MLANGGSEPREGGGRVWSSGSPRVSAPFLQELVPGWLSGCWVLSASVLGGASGGGREGTDLGVSGARSQALALRQPAQLGINKTKWNLGPSFPAFFNLSLNLAIRGS